MPIRQKAREAGVFSSSEVALLGRVFDRLQVEGQSPQRREALASRILANYEAGITDEEDWLRRQSCRWGAKRLAASLRLVRLWKRRSSNHYATRVSLAFASTGPKSKCSVPKFIAICDSGIGLFGIVRTPVAPVWPRIN